MKNTSDSFHGWIHFKWQGPEKKGEENDTDPISKNKKNGVTSEWIGVGAGGLQMGI